MKPLHATRTIRAPLPSVFQAIADARNFSKAVPHILDVEFLTDQRVGAGTRFRETRRMNGRQSVVELDVIEYVVDEHVRLVFDEGGTIWDTLFKVSAIPRGVLLDMQMDVKPHTLLARVLTPFIRGMVVKGVESDMDAIKSFCESG